MKVTWKTFSSSSLLELPYFRSGVVAASLAYQMYAALLAPSQIENLFAQDFLSGDISHQGVLFVAYVQNVRYASRAYPDEKSVCSRYLFGFLYRHSGDLRSRFIRPESICVQLC